MTSQRKRRKQENPNPSEQESEQQRKPPTNKPTSAVESDLDLGPLTPYCAMNRTKLKKIMKTMEIKRWGLRPEKKIQKNAQQICKDANNSAQDTVIEPENTTPHW